MRQQLRQVHQTIGVLGYSYHLTLASMSEKHWHKSTEDAHLIEYLRYGFPVGNEGPVPTPTTSNHASALHHPCDLVVDVTMEFEEGRVLGPYVEQPFVPWCQMNALLRMPKKDSHLCRVIMDLSWLHPLDISVNAYSQ